MSTFAEYMEQVLYGPEGYYSAGAAKSGRTGDYFTAPDVGAVFGRLLADIFLSWKDKLRVDPFTLIEAGAGEGRLAADILNAEPFRYIAIERSLSRREALKRIPTVDVYSDLVSAPPMEGVLFGNELIDAFPVHRVRMKNGRSEEAYVNSPRPRHAGEGWGEGTVLPSSQPSPDTRSGEGVQIVWSSPSTPRLQSYFERLGIALPDDYETEVNLAMADWLKEAAQVLQKGLVVLIDYGRPAHEYYAPERTRGTLRAFSKHRVSSEVLDPGTVDLTADVDFTSLALDAREAGFVPLAFMEMGSFLMSAVSAYGRMGGSANPIFDVADTPTRRHANLSLRYLLHPEGLGAAFHVLILGKNIDPAEWMFEHNRMRRLGLPL